MQEPPPINLKRLRTLLVLGRTSNLPTVWSNCIVGWILAGGDFKFSFVTVILGATLLYVGGMYLNDAVDISFDRKYRAERPIPSGQISHREVVVLGAAWMFLGLVCFALTSWNSLFWALLLVAAILVYDFFHKLVTFAPVLMGSCRFLLLLTAASAAQGQVTGPAFWSAIALAAYIIGLSYLARQESRRGTLKLWPLSLLLCPVALALLTNAGAYFKTACLLSILLIIWVAWCLRNLWGPQRNIGYAVSGLLAGIVFVDLLALATANVWLLALFFVLFLLARIFQRYIPAT